MGLYVSVRDVVRVTIMLSCQFTDNENSPPSTYCDCKMHVSMGEVKFISKFFRIIHLKMSLPAYNYIIRATQHQQQITNQSAVLVYTFPASCF